MAQRKLDLLQGPLDLIGPSLTRSGRKQTTKGAAHGRRLSGARGRVRAMPTEGAR